MEYPAHRWVLPGLLIVLAQAIASAGLAVWLDIHLVPPTIDYVRESIKLVGLFIAIAAFIETFRLMRDSHPHPCREIARLVAANRARLALILFGAILVMIQWSLMTWSKVVLPLTVGLWADPLLANIDTAIFGQDAWRLFHFANLNWLELPYNAWFLVVVAGIVWFICQPASFLRDRAILSHLLCISLVGMLSIYLLPSGGPIFYERLGFGSRFADLPILHVTQMTSDYLWRVHTGVQTNVGAGISAMPSMHVALVFWLAQHSTRWRIPAWIFFALIFYGSVYLGWHYFIDGLAGVAGAWFCTRIVDAWLKRSAFADEGAELVSIRAKTRGHN